MKNIFKQFIHFTGFSGIGWLLDFSVYTVLAFLSVNLFFCNIAGAVAGLTFVYIFSTRFIFNVTDKRKLFAKYFIYVLYQIILVYCISKLLVFINGIIVSNLHFSYVKEFSAVFSKCLVTPVTMTINFFAMKFLTEKI